MRVLSKINGLAGILLLCLAMAGNADASQIARPLYWAIPTWHKPGGQINGRIEAIARSGLASGFLVVHRRNVSGDFWLGIRVGKRPNDRVTWVPAQMVTTKRTRGRLTVSLKNRRMTLHLGRYRAWTAKVIVGKPSTPSPRGLFAIHDFYRVNDDLRPWVIETTAHSEVLRSFLGGPARVAIHGRHGALMAPWGKAVSNGCIRAPDWALRSIRKRLAIGAPIRIRW